MDPATHTHQEQWPFTTGHGSGDGPKTPLLRGARGKEQCRLVQWELEMHSRKLPWDLELIFVRGVKPRFNCSGFPNILAEVTTPSTR